jgi:hypothetical protein
MKAEQRKEIESNSLILNVQRLRQKMSGRGLYYLIGAIVLVSAGVLFYRYFSRQSDRARDAMIKDLDSADTPEKLKAGMESHRGSDIGNMFKLHLARHLLLNEGLPKLGTNLGTARTQAAAAIVQARDYFLELTKDLKEKEEPALVQESWHSAAQAEEALIGLPATEGGSDYRGNIDKAIEYYEKAAAIFSDSEPSKRYKAWAEKLTANKAKVVEDYKALYKPRQFPFEHPPIPGGKTDSFGKSDPSFPKLPPFPFPAGPGDPPVTPPDPKKTDPPKIEAPPIPPPPPVDPKKGETPKGETPPVVPPPPKADPPKPDPKAK